MPVTTKQDAIEIMPEVINSDRSSSSFLDDLGQTLGRAGLPFLTALALSGCHKDRVDSASVDEQKMRAAAVQVDSIYRGLVADIPFVDKYQENGKQLRRNEQHETDPAIMADFDSQADYALVRAAIIRTIRSGDTTATQLDATPGALERSRTLLAIYWATQESDFRMMDFWLNAQHDTFLSPDQGYGQNAAKSLRTLSTLLKGVDALPLEQRLEFSNTALCQMDLNDVITKVDAAASEFAKDWPREYTADRSATAAEAVKALRTSLSHVLGIIPDAYYTEHSINAAANEVQLIYAGLVDDIPRVDALQLEGLQLAEQAAHANDPAMSTDYLASSEYSLARAATIRKISSRNFDATQVDGSPGVLAPSKTMLALYITAKEAELRTMNVCLDSSQPQARKSAQEGYHRLSVILTGIDLLPIEQKKLFGRNLFEKTDLRDIIAKVDLAAHAFVPGSELEQTSNISNSVFSAIDQLQRDIGRELGIAPNYSLGADKVVHGSGGQIVTM